MRTPDIALIKNNAKVAAEISFHLSEIKNSYTENHPENLQTFAGQGISGKHPVSKTTLQIKELYSTRRGLKGRII